MIETIRAALLSQQEPSYRDFMQKLLPALPAEKIIGIRTPVLRSMAKQYKNAAGIDRFLNDLPHRYFEENNLHAFLLEDIRDYDECVRRIDCFLPCVDNWATCDQLRPRCFYRHRSELISEIEGWIASDSCYTVRFAIGMLMQHYLKEDYQPRYPAMVAAVRSDEYYVRMMIAWYFATALTYRFDDVLPYISERRLPAWIHAKTIQKAIESRQISPERKAYLKTLR